MIPLTIHALGHFICTVVYMMVNLGQVITQGVAVVKSVADECICH